MASPTQWTWLWVSSWSWWWTGNPGVLQSVGLQRIRHDWAPELNWFAIWFLGRSKWFAWLVRGLCRGILEISKKEGYERAGWQDPGRWSPNIRIFVLQFDVHSENLSFVIENLTILSAGQNNLFWGYQPASPNGESGFSCYQRGPVFCPEVEGGYLLMGWNLTNDRRRWEGIKQIRNLL